MGTRHAHVAERDRRHYRRRTCSAKTRRTPTRQSPAQGAQQGWVLQRQRRQLVQPYIVRHHKAPPLRADGMQRKNLGRRQGGHDGVDPVVRRDGFQRHERANASEALRKEPSVIPAASSVAEADRYEFGGKQASQGSNARAQCRIAHAGGLLSKSGPARFRVCLDRKRRTSDGIVRDQSRTPHRRPF